MSFISVAIPVTSLGQPAVAAALANLTKELGIPNIFDLSSSALGTPCPAPSVVVAKDALLTPAANDNGQAYGSVGNQGTFEDEPSSFDAHQRAAIAHLAKRADTDKATTQQVINLCLAVINAGDQGLPLTELKQIVPGLEGRAIGGLRSGLDKGLRNAGIKPFLFTKGDRLYVRWSADFRLPKPPA